VWKEKNGLNLKAVVHAFVWLVAFLRFLYFATDPLGQTGDVPFLFEQLIFGYGFFCIFSGFLFVLLFWAGAYHFSMKTKTDLFFARMKVIFFVVDFIWFIIELFYRIMSGLHEQAIIPQWETFDTAYNVYITLICAVFSGGFAIYGTLLVRELKGMSKTVTTTRLHKLTEAVVILSVTFFIIVVALLAVIVTNAIYTPFGAIASFSVAHFLEALVCVEMTYVMRPASAEDSNYSSNTASTTLNSSLSSSQPSVASIHLGKTDSRSTLTSSSNSTLLESSEYA